MEGVPASAGRQEFIESGFSRTVEGSMSDAHAAEDIKKSVRTYFAIFGALMVLTVVTVGVSYVHLPIAMAILVALVVATIKGSLVAMYFMHLSHEKKLIYYVLALTVVFFVFLMFIPLATNLDRIRIRY
jgi:caa(3)-type oxidase subunit IV